MTDKQKVTIAIDKKLLVKIRHIVRDRHTSLSGLLTKMLQELVESEERFQDARSRQLELMAMGLDLGLITRISGSREELHER